MQYIVRTILLEEQEGECIGRRDDAADPQRNARKADRRDLRQDLNGDRTTDHLLNVAADDGDLGHDPQKVARYDAVLFATQFGEVLASYDSQASRQHLASSHGQCGHHRMNVRIDTQAQT